MKTLSLTIALAAALGGAAFAAPGHAKTKTAAKPVLICPVTGEKIASVKDAQGSSTYKGKTYYFCCSSCKPEFDKNPAKYVHAMASARAKYATCLNVRSERVKLVSTACRGPKPLARQRRILRWLTMIYGEMM